jgi:hypothetical protein
LYLKNFNDTKVNVLVSRSNAIKGLICLSITQNYCNKQHIHGGFHCILQDYL